MNWTNIVAQIFEILIFPLLGICAIYLTTLIKTKIQELKQKQNNEIYIKYLTMLENTISDCVLATTQTYVDSLKKQGSFNEEAQKIAFQKTYENVMAILTTDAKEYLENAVGDLETYINNKIEAVVILNK